MERSHSLDLIKGIAVLVMIFANTSIYFFNFKEFNLVRLICSLAAPIFIVLTGYFTQMNLFKQSVNKNALITRALQILFLGAFIDLALWQTIPFITFDILYLIGFSQLILIFLNSKYFNGLILLIFLGTFLLPYIIKYRFEIDDISLQLFDGYKTILIAAPLKRLLYDGWFPLFPWFAFALMGASAFKNRLFFSKNSNYFFPIALTLIGLVYLIIMDKVIPTRNSYMEIWYPLKNIQLLIPLSVFFVIVGSLNNRNYRPFVISNFLTILGKNSLFAYISNSLLMALAISWGLNQNTNPLFSILFFMFFIVILVFIMNKFRQSNKWDFTPRVLKYFLGYN